MERKVKATRTVPGNGSEQRANGRVACPQTLMGPRWRLRRCPTGPPSPTGRLGDLLNLRTRWAAEWPASAERGSRRRQGHGPPRGRGRRLGPAGRPRAPWHRHGRRHRTSGRARPAPRARLADHRNSRPANHTHPAICDVHAEPRQEQGRRRRASVRAAAARSTSAREPGAGGGREARAPVGRGRGAVRTTGTNGIAASGLRGRGIPPGGGTRTSEAERGRTRAHRGDQSERGRLDGGRGLIPEGGAGAVLYLRPGAEVRTSPAAVCGSVNPSAYESTGTGNPSLLRKVFLRISS